MSMGELSISPDNQDAVLWNVLRGRARREETKVKINEAPEHNKKIGIKANMNIVFMDMMVIKTIPPKVPKMKK